MRAGLACAKRIRYPTGMAERRSAHSSEDEAGDAQPSELNIIFGTNVRILRQGAGLTQKQLAERQGNDASYIGMLERGINSAKYIPKPQ